MTLNSTVCKINGTKIKPTKNTKKNNKSKVGTAKSRESVEKSPSLRAASRPTRLL